MSLLIKQLVLFNRPPQTWLQWKEWAHECGVTVLDDDSGYTSEQIINGDDAHRGLQICTCKIQRIEERMSISQWRAEFNLQLKNPPNAGDILYTEDNSLIKLTIEYYEDKEPFVFTRVYMPMKVGSKLGWFAQSINDNSYYGWKVIILPKYRNEVLYRFGVGKTEVPVREITITRRSKSGKSFTGSISQW